MHRLPIIPVYPMRPSIRNLLSMTLLIILVGIICGVLTIPFLFESPSMYYKFGWDKTLLRSGKMAGLTAAIFLLLQLPLAARLKWLDRIYALPFLYTIHRYNAYAIVGLIIFHPIAILAPDGNIMIPFEIRYWPEWVGAGLWLLIGVQFVFGQWRRKLTKGYDKWLILHRIMGAVAIALLFMHVLYVSETFENDGFPRKLAMASVIGITALWIWVRIHSIHWKKKSLKVTSVRPAGENAFTIEIEPPYTRPFVYLPGQFVFVSFESKHISKEAHPFTLSSTPTRPQGLAFTIRCSGDWTRQIKSIKPGDKAFIQGPFGRFSHIFVPSERVFIMIAGGIGITPMLSMLRYMHDLGDTRRSILIWSNQTPRHSFGVQELKAMGQKLTDFKYIPIFTREKGANGPSGRLDRKKLATLLRPYGRGGTVFICGPIQMIKNVRSDLLKIGFSKKSIHFETFGL